MLKFKRITAADYKMFDGVALRKADVDEMRASTGIQDPGEALRLSLEYSTEWTEVAYEPDTGAIVAVYGLGSVSDLIGTPWMVATNTLLRHKKMLIRYSQITIADMLDQFPYLCNYMDHRNDVHTCWLKRMGFKFDHSRDITINGYQFDYFYMRREPNV